jgi:hypothetical protein
VFAAAPDGADAVAVIVTLGPGAVTVAVELVPRPGAVTVTVAVDTEPDASVGALFPALPIAMPTKKATTPTSKGINHPRFLPLGDAVEVGAVADAVGYGAEGIAVVGSAVALEDRPTASSTGTSGCPRSGDAHSPHRLACTGQP